MVPEWKYEVISINLITGILRIVKKNDPIIFVVDKLSKVDHFILVKTTYSAREVVQIFIRDILRLDGILKRIMLDRDVKFTSKFWKELF